MLVAKAYLHASPASETLMDEKRHQPKSRSSRARQTLKEKEVTKSDSESTTKEMARSSVPKTPQPKMAATTSAASRANAPQILSITNAVPARPMVIPTRTLKTPSRTRQIAESTSTADITSRSLATTELPFSMTALLNSTSIPPRLVSSHSLASDSRTRRKRSIPTSHPRKSFSSSSPASWSILQAPPEEEKEADSSSVSPERQPQDDWPEDADTTASVLTKSFTRSMSFDSIPSLLSDDDRKSLNSSTTSATTRMSSPLTPWSQSDRRTSLRKKLSIAELRPLHENSEPSGPDPLSGMENEHDFFEAASPTRTPLSTSLPRLHLSTTPSPQPQSPISPSDSPRLSTSKFKSNLTASLKALKTRASSFSILPIRPFSLEVYTTKTALSPHWTDEKRPLTPLPQSNSSLAPAPPEELRRYLNPQHPPSPPLSPLLSPQQRCLEKTGEQERKEEDLEYFISSSPFLDLDASPVDSPPSSPSSSVQMQSYIRRISPSSNATLPPIFSSPSKAGFPFETYPSPSPIDINANTRRQREPRENSAFLRQVVAEMNMRRRGVLGTGSPLGSGRARLWLPPRRDGDALGKRKRWVAVSCY